MSKSQKDRQEQLKAIEDLIEEDLSNGRHTQKKLQKRLSDNGQCSKQFCKNLEALKTTG